MKKVTIKDVAVRSGFSIATVSKTLNGTDRVGAETMEKIRRIADEMGYRGNRSAQALVKGVRRIAIVLFQTPEVVRRMFESGFKEAFALYGDFGFVPEYHYFTAEKGMIALDWDEISTNADAMIVVPGTDFHLIKDKFDEIGKTKPLIFLQSKQPGQSSITHLCDVTVDARTVGRMAAKLLALTSPQSEVAMISGYNNVWIHSENQIGFMEGAKVYGLNVCAVEESCDKMERADTLTRMLLNKYPTLSGIFVSSYVSPAVCNALKQMKKRLPVVGVDLFPGSIDCLKDGSLTSAIFQNQKLQAQLSLEMAVNALRNETVQPQCFVKPELILDANLDGYDK